MNFSDQKQTSHDRNKVYFDSFIRTRGSIGSLYISWAGLVIALVCLPITWSIALESYHVSPFKNGINLVIMCIIAFMLITIAMISFRFTRNRLIKHQGFASLWLVLFVIVLTFILMFLGYLLTQYGMVDDQQSAVILYESNFSIAVSLILSIIYLVSLLYNFFWIKEQLRVGFSEKRTSLNYIAQTKVYESKSLMIIFGITMIFSIFSGIYMTIIGLACGILFGVAFSRLTIELAYSAYLLNKDKSFWVNYIDLPSRSLKERVNGRFKKNSTYVLLGIILIIVISQIEQRYVIPKTLHIVFSYIATFILIGIGIIFVIWLIKKIKFKNDGGKNK